MTSSCGKCNNTDCAQCYQLDNPEPTLPMGLPENPKAIYGRAKPSLGLVPGTFMVETAKVFELGATKYGPFNWRKDPVEAETYMNAALRHLFSWFDGEDWDQESGASHLAHAAACLAILIDAEYNSRLIDNRPIPGMTSVLIAENTKPIP